MKNKDQNYEIKILDKEDQKNLAIGDSICIKINLNSGVTDEVLEYRGSDEFGFYFMDNDVCRVSNKLSRMYMLVCQIEFEDIEY